MTLDREKQEELRERMRRVPSTREAVVRFLGSYVMDADSNEEIVSHIDQRVRVNPKGLIQAVTVRVS